MKTLKDIRKEEVKYARHNELSVLVDAFGSVENLFKDRIKELDDEVSALSHVSSWNFDARTRHKEVLIRIEELEKLLG